MRLLEYGMNLLADIWASDKPKLHSNTGYHSH